MIGAKSLDLLTTMLPNAFLHRGYVISEAIMEMRAEIAVFPEVVLDWYVSQLNRNDIEPWSGYSYSSLIAERIAGTSDEAARSSLISWCRAQINSRVAENQMNAAKILSKISRSPSQQTIIRLWKKLLPSKFWQTASAALREIGNLEAIEILEEWWIPRLSDTSTPRYDYEGVTQGYGYKAWQHYAARELERIATPKAIKSLVQYWSESLKRGSLYGSREAIEALQRIDSTEARNALAEWKSRNRL
jgi:hypothetical protein